MPSLNPEFIRVNLWRKQFEARERITLKSASLDSVTESSTNTTQLARIGSEFESLTKNSTSYADVATTAGNSPSSVFICVNLWLKQFDARERTKLKSTSLDSVTESSTNTTRLVRVGSEFESHAKNSTSYADVATTTFTSPSSVFICVNLWLKQLGSHDRSTLKSASLDSVTESSTKTTVRLAPQRFHCTLES